MAWAQTGNIRGPQGPAGPTNLFIGQLTADVSFGTSLTAIAGLDIALVTGTYHFQADLDWSVDVSTNVSFVFRYSGTASNNAFRLFRYTSSAIVFTPGLSIGTTYVTSSTTPQGLTANGMFVATTPGTFGVSMLRAGASVGSLKKSSGIRIFKA
jgi:hypothetical protein